MNILHYNKQGDLLKDLKQSSGTTTKLIATKRNGEDDLLYECRGWNNLLDLWEAGLKHCHINNKKDLRIVIQEL